MQGSLLSASTQAKYLLRCQKPLGPSRGIRPVALTYATELMMVAPHSSSLDHLYKYSEHAVAFTSRRKLRNAV